MAFHAPGDKFSQEIQRLLVRLADQPLTLADVLAETEERGFSLVIGLLVLPFLFPMPPGLTTVLGPGALVLAVQMAWGRRSPWLPRRIAQFQFPVSLSRHLLNNLRRVTRCSERLVRPRLTTFAESRQIWKLNGVCMVWLTLLLMSPIPMTNPIPTIGILIFVIATLEVDGLMMGIGYAVTGLITGFFGLLVYGLWQSSGLLWPGL